MTDKIIMKEQTYPCSVAEMWKLWTTADGLKKFIGRQHNVELRIGGPYEIFFMVDAPVGMRGSDDCKIISYVPERQLTVSWNQPPSIPEARSSGKFQWVTLDMIAEGNGTKLTLHHHGFPEGEVWDEVYCYFVDAWSSVFESLNEAFQRQ
jgi:uncharacterized protein YndB with AHSA1/START domain